MNTLLQKTVLRPAQGRKRLARLLYAFLPLLLAFSCLAAQEGDFTYELSGNSATLTGYGGTQTHVVVPDRLGGKPVTVIGDRAFEGKSSLAQILLPNTLTTIGEWAFSGCTGLTSLTIPNSVTTIREYAFYGCSSLAAIYFLGSSPAEKPSELNYYPTRVFFKPGTTGWGTSFGGLPTAPWIPVPEYSAWASEVGLVAAHPDASQEGDDADLDGVTNLEELRAATDPLDPESRLVLELEARPGELSAEDRTPIPEGQLAIYFRSIPGKTYGVQRLATIAGTVYYDSLTEPVEVVPQPQLVRVVKATHTQTRVLAERDWRHPEETYFRVFALGDLGIAP